jgi:pyrroline-5-carboxylate reductase
MKLLLIGAGNMGGAMLGNLTDHDITVVESYPPRVSQLKSLYPQVKFVDKIPKLDNFIVILAIKPQTFPKISFDGNAQCIISIMAGVSIESLSKHINAKSYIRAMPNMAALVGKSATAVCGDKEYKNEALEILQSIGQCFWVESENELNIATAIAGSAPAWIALVAEALSDGAVKCGLKRDDSYHFVSALFDGMGELLQSEHPALLKDKVMSPGGTTAAGYARLEEGKVRDSFIKAVESAYEKAKKI